MTRIEAIRMSLSSEDVDEIIDHMQASSDYSDYGATFSNPLLCNAEETRWADSALACIETTPWETAFAGYRAAENAVLESMARIRDALSKLNPLEKEVEELTGRDQKRHKELSREYEKYETLLCKCRADWKTTEKELKP